MFSTLQELSYFTTMKTIQFGFALNADEIETVRMFPQAATPTARSY